MPARVEGAGRPRGCGKEETEERRGPVGLKFIKMHGLGNDYLYVLGNPDRARERYGLDASELSIRLSDRHFGVGSDGMIWIAPADDADCLMRIFNADGSEAMMCGNGVRCVGKYLYDKGLVDRLQVRVKTRSGMKGLELSPGPDGMVERVAVRMGRATVDDERVVEALGAEVRLVPVDVGNPHAVVFVEDALAAPVASLGAALERHAAFPDGVNVEFVEVTGDNELRMRVWERGSGITMACGTGSCASAAAAVRAGLVDGARPVHVVLDGGELLIEVAPDGEVVMTGPAATVCEGEVEL